MLHSTVCQGYPETSVQRCESYLESFWKCLELCLARPLRSAQLPSRTLLKLIIQRAFLTFIMEDDRAYVEDEWNNISVRKQKRTFEMRIVPKWYHKESNTWKNKWMLASARHDENEDGSVKCVVGCITDISLQKQAQEDALDRAALSDRLARSQKEATEIQISSRMEAEAAKMSMEKFMDITSHEMRNPLSAILQSADGIALSLQRYQTSEKTLIMADELVEDNLEAIQIITVRHSISFTNGIRSADMTDEKLCAKHQGRIINDVLTLSKIESAMLLVSPVPTQPSNAVRGVLKMFEGEMQCHDIELDLFLEKSYKSSAIDWVMIDPARVAQILINLMTNAIKFTKSAPTRSISVSLGGSGEERPVHENVELAWFPSSGVRSKPDLTLEPDWGEGEPVFVSFAVHDTGRGLTNEEKRRLFHRFAVQ